MMSKPSFWQPTADPRAGADPRLRAPSAQRNRDAILAVLADILPPSGRVLEVASGSGEHAVHFAGALPGLTFQPSDPAPDAVASIAAWAQESGLGNILPPLVVDATAPDWPVTAIDAILCINMIHIAPWAAAEGLFRQAGRLLKPGQPLYLYGPYRRPDRPLEPGNAAFDESLRSRDPAWGLRDLDAVTALGLANGFGAPEIVEMPANNLSVIFRKS
jgi:SAM-dependent methyltransferase